MSYLQHYFEKIAPEERDTSAIAFMASLDHLEKQHPEVVGAIVQELRDQRSYLKMIASENYSSMATQLAMGNLLTDKYSEGYVHHRFYAGCDNVDRVEELATQEAKELFGADHAYVQPHSGADANLVAFWSILVQRVQLPEVIALGKKKVDELTSEEYEKVRSLLVNQKMMGLGLGSGGHLTHGYRHNVSAKMMKAVAYEVDPKTERIDYKALEKQVKEERPAILVGGYSSYPRLINFAIMRQIADTVGATLMVDMAHFAGLVAGKAITGEFDPVPYAHVVTSTTHKTLRGPRGGLILCKKEFGEVIDKGCPLVLGGPLPHVMAAKAVAFKEAKEQSFQVYAKQVIKNAKAMAEKFLQLGVDLFTGGTDNHLLVLDVNKSFGLTGRQAENLLREAKITANRNAIPFDQNGAWFTSGIRLGTPALTTLGMGVKEMEKIAELIVFLLKEAKPKREEGKLSRSKAEAPFSIIERVGREVEELLKQYPLYPELKLMDGTCSPIY